MNPQFIIYTGPMFGSKTTRLLGDIDRFSRKGKNVIAFKAKKDIRYDRNKICSHNGGSTYAYCVNTSEELLSLYKELDSYEKIDVVAVDEAFMISGIAEALIGLYHSGITIIVSSIQLDAGEKPFESIRDMMPWATKIEICSAVCSKCDQDAYFTEALFDINNASAEEKVGAEGMYEPRCWKHYSAFNK